MLLQVLSGASLILGIYLLFLFLYSGEAPVTKAQAVYHLGCYDPANPNNQSLELMKRLQEMQSLARQKTQLNLYHSKALQPGFNNKVNQVAKSFETYLDHFYKFKGANDQDINYYNSLQLAKMQYHRCSGQNFFNQTECSNDWSEYTQYLNQVDWARGNITDLIRLKQKNEAELTGKILSSQNTPSQQIQAQYNAKIKNLTAKTQAEQLRLAELRATKNTVKSQMSSVDIELTQLKSILDQCINNVALIRYCNEITQEIQKIQTNAPMVSKQKLEARMATKLAIINGLENSIKKENKQEGSTDLARLKRELATQKNQLRLLEYQIQNFQTSEESKCAMCSEQRIKELNQNISDLEARKKQQEKKLLEIELLIIATDQAHHTLSKQLETVISQKQSAVISQFCLTEACKNERQQFLTSKRLTLNQLKKEIIDKRLQLALLQQSAGQRLNRMQQYLQPIDRIHDCLQKQHYYRELKARRPAERKIDPKMVEAVQAIQKQLVAFEL